jgi:dipeptidyl aminopeptidase/acylaminoacyl peptidase
VELSGNNWEHFTVTTPQGVTIPGYFVRAGASGERRPPVVINNGSDAQFVDLHAYGVAAALERGYNAVVFEGPGQGSLLFERGIPFTPDWGPVISAIVDFLVARPDVDPRRVALTGWSMGENLVIRAAAVEHRLVAVVAIRPSSTCATLKFTFAKRSEIYSADLLRQARADTVLTDVQEFTRLLDAFDLTPALAVKVDAAVLLTEYELDPFLSGEAARLKP